MVTLDRRPLRLSVAEYRGSSQEVISLHDLTILPRHFYQNNLILLHLPALMEEICISLQEDRSFASDSSDLNRCGLTNFNKKQSKTINPKKERNE